MYNFKINYTRIEFRLIKKILRTLFLRFYLPIFDPKRVQELSGTRVVFHHMMRKRFLSNLKNKRILEIGPKHGEDSKLLARLSPKELVLIDLPEKNYMVKTWLTSVKKICKTKYVKANLLYLSKSQLKKIGKFDIIFCLGVFYHNVEQIRLLRRLFNLCQNGGKVVIESATTRNKKLEKLNVVELFWPHSYKNVPTITHLPSRQAIKSWLEMVGFSQVKIWKDVYSRDLRWQRTVITAVKSDTQTAYINYRSELSPVYIAGEST